MRRHLVAAIAVLWLLAGMLPATVAAASVTPAPQASVSVDDVRDCADAFPNAQHVGIEQSSPHASQNRVGVRAIIHLYSAATLNDCNGPDAWSVATAWVALTPRLADNNQQILQIGIIRCHSMPSLWDEVCDDHPNELRYFWAYGGCNGFSPHARDLGAVTTPADEFMVLRGSTHFFLYRNDTVQRTIAINDQGINCWSNDQLKAWAMGERLDRGDSFGDSVAIYTEFVNVQYKAGSISGSNPWQTFNKSNCDWNQGGAAGSYNQTFCTMLTFDDMRIWD